MSKTAINQATAWTEVRRDIFFERAAIALTASLGGASAASFCGGHPIAGTVTGVFSLFTFALSAHQPELIRQKLSLFALKK
ncbi:MAG: hypothetical protein SFW62_08260 [Alphaproteobacteria bacterium]|nr:hypothetical protein [Alphaproteobacteria bacterium]